MIYIFKIFVHPAFILFLIIVVSYNLYLEFKAEKKIQKEGMKFFLKEGR
jgi:hypothetical protein